VDSENRTAKVGVHGAEDSTGAFSSAKRKAPSKESTRKVPNYL
jgi:hypothetical protein